MDGSGRSAIWRRQVVALPVALLIAVVGALVWSRTVADDGDDVLRLDTPGEFIDPASTNVANGGDALPAFELTDAEGETVRLEPDGRPLVVNLWYSTCPPCARELTAFAAVDRELGEEVRFVGVNPYDDTATMSEFAASRGVEYELLLDPDFAVAEELGILQFPVTLFVSADGAIAVQTGALSEDELREHVAELLA